jgi:hypothetical protein
MFIRNPFLIQYLGFQQSLNQPDRLLIISELGEMSLEHKLEEARKAPEKFPLSLRFQIARGDPKKYK